ncbi:hypothetical protein [Streptomyces sp. NPDC087307]
MQAAATWRTHLKTCAPCRSEQHCTDGALLYQRASDLQDAHISRLRSGGKQR